MQEKKMEPRIFTIADWEKEEQYLRKRHREGWKFVKVNLPGLYHFEKCSPEDVVYQMDYNQEVAETARNEVKDVAAAYPRYAKEILSMVERYDR